MPETRENYPLKTNLPAPQRYGRRDAGSPNDAPGKGGGGRRVASRFVTYARVLPVPAAWAGHTVFLDLNNARYYAKVQIDGQPVAQFTGGLEPHRIDITPYLTPGKSAMLCVTVGDKGIAAIKPFDPASNRNGANDNLTFAPNIWYANVRDLNEASVDAVPNVHTDYVFANPKVSLGKLFYTVMLVNDSHTDWKGHVQSEAVGAKRLVDEEVVVPANSTKKIYHEIPWADAIPWDLDTPHLYDLKTTLTARGKLVDVQTDYFGFREFAIRGADFYLNGKKIHLLGQSGHVHPAQDQMSLEAKIRFLRGQGDRPH